MRHLKGYIFSVLLYCLPFWVLAQSESPKLAHYAGCINIGISDTLLLKVSDADDKERYHWQIPTEWQPIGDTDKGELWVVTHETNDTTRIYGVSFFEKEDSWSFDTVPVRGADTTLFILVNKTQYYVGGKTKGTYNVVDYRFFDLLWYKGSFDEKNYISKAYYTVASRFGDNKALLKYRRKGEGCWSATDKMVFVDSIHPSIVHYEGCVNIGVPDTLLLRVENALAGVRYHWQIPSEWQPIGDTNRSELQVITHETKDTTRIYGVLLSGGWQFDTVHVKGADTVVVILDDNFTIAAFPSDLDYLDEKAFEFRWYKDSIGGDFVGQYVVASKYKFDGASPILAYRRYNSGCWSVTDEVVLWDSIFPLRIQPYNGCVKIGATDTLLLRVENADTRLRYHWQIPSEWQPIGDIGRGELRVVTHETKTTTRIYGVTFQVALDPRSFDTIQVGADTTLIIVDDDDVYIAMTDGLDVLDDDAFEFRWYKDSLGGDYVDRYVVIPKQQFDGAPPILEYRYNSGCWSVTDEVVLWDSVYPSRIQAYEGCVNIGIPDTLLLRVENADNRLRYHWQLPETWEPIGETNRGQLQVITHETKDTTRIYGVSFGEWEDSWSFDTVQVKGADTTLIILLADVTYELSNENFDVFSGKNFDCFWYKGNINDESVIVNSKTKKPVNSIYMLEYQLDGKNPIVQYRLTKGSQCWSVTDKVVQWSPKLAHYEGCVNLGIPDTLLLKVSDADDKECYHWQIPTEWQPIGDTNKGELRVVTHETKDTTRIYGVSFFEKEDSWSFDTVQVRGADTVILIVDVEDLDMYVAMNEDLDFVDADVFTYSWYKTILSLGNFVDSFDMVAKYWFEGEPPILAYRYDEGCWSVTEEVVLIDSIHPSIVHYEGCVNIGVPDTLLLRVENADNRLHYHWQLPETWEPIGETNRGQLQVITHENKDTTRIYGVSFGEWEDSWSFDTVQVRGADTTLFILVNRTRYYAVFENTYPVSTNIFDFSWYKGTFNEENWVTNASWALEPQFGGQAPLLKYRKKENNACWSATDKVVLLDTIHPSIVHYDGCVNIGVPDTLLLRVENALAGVRYHWQIPSEWQPIGDTNRSELQVITHETKDTTRVYGVSFGEWEDSWSFDTVQVRGADTMLFLSLRQGRYIAVSARGNPATAKSFDFGWYKGNLSEENFVASSSWILEYQLEGKEPLLKYRYKENNACWSVTDEVVQWSPKLAHYEGCVNVGIPDTLLLKVLDANDKKRYHWQLPTEWQPIGDTNRSELQVITHETKDTTRIYGVVWGDSVFAFDTIQIRGADTTIYIGKYRNRYIAVSLQEKILSDNYFDFEWYDVDFLTENKIAAGFYAFEYQFPEKKPLLKYRYKENEGCWSATDKVIESGNVVNVEIVGNGKVWVRSEDIPEIYGALETSGQYSVFVEREDTLSFQIEPAAGFYLDRIEIEDKGDISLVPNSGIIVEENGKFSLRGRLSWHPALGKPRDTADETYRFVFTAKQYVLHDLGRDTVCSGDSVKMGALSAFHPGWNYDTVAGEKPQVDTVYRLYLHINPTYRDTLRLAVERDSLPYIHGNDTIGRFGLSGPYFYQTVAGCDSIEYVQLDTLYIHRERHFHDTLSGCVGDTLRWRGREITRAGEYTDTVADPYRGGTDSIHHLRADIYPTYYDTLHFTAEPDSLPYIHGRDTIWRFGLTEVGRYLTVHGCDSVEYVRLDTLYIHRERHFYDTLCACGHAQLSRPGMVIVVLQTSDFVDTVFDPNRGGTDSIQHLHVEIYPLPVYQSLYTDSCYIEQLPYTVGGRAIQDFGRTTVPLLTEHGCDSTVSYDLRRRWRYYRVSVETRGSGTASVGDTTLREDGSLWLTLTASACHRLDSLRVNGADVPARERYLVENLRGDCFVEAVFAPSGPGESELTLDVCADSLPVVYNGREYGAGGHEVRLHTATGCDSVVHLRVVGRENTATLSVRDTIEPPCGESVMSLTYAVEAGSPRSLRVAFDAAARATGFRDTALAIGGGGRVLLPLPEAVQPGRYGLGLYQADGSGCHAQAGSLAFEVRYPSDIIVQKWDDVLAVLSPEYNGGYAFSGYQWYRNGEAVAGATSACYTPGRYLRYGDEYAVLLERASDGLRLLSCVYKARRAPGAAVLHLAPNPSRAGEGVRATVEDRPESSGHMEVYDGMGRRVYRAAFGKGTHLLRIDTPGTYLVRAVSADGRWTASGKMVVM